MVSAAGVRAALISGLSSLALGSSRGGVKSGPIQGTEPLQTSPGSDMAPTGDHIWKYAVLYATIGVVGTMVVLYATWPSHSEGTKNKSKLTVKGRQRRSRQRGAREQGEAEEDRSGSSADNQDECECLCQELQRLSGRGAVRPHATTAAPQPPVPRSAAHSGAAHMEETTENRSSGAGPQGGQQPHAVGGTAVAGAGAAAATEADADAGGAQAAGGVTSPANPHVPTQSLPRTPPAPAVPGTQAPADPPNPAALGGGQLAMSPARAPPSGSPAEDKGAAAPSSTRSASRSRSPVRPAGAPGQSSAVQTIGASGPAQAARAAASPPAAGGTKSPVLASPPPVFGGAPSILGALTAPSDPQPGPAAPFVFGAQPTTPMAPGQGRPPAAPRPAVNPPFTRREVGGSRGRAADRGMRREQDAAPARLLEEDQVKAALQATLDQHKAEARAQQEECDRRRRLRASRLPMEPEAKEPDVTQLVFRVGPHKLMRRFFHHDPLQVVLDFLGSLPEVDYGTWELKWMAGQGSFTAADHGRCTLADLGLSPNAVLVVQHSD